LSPVFFTDRDLGIRFPEILRSAGLAVERHQDHFADNTPDEDWLEQIGIRGWVALTHDGRIRYKPNELAAVVAHRVTLLVIIGAAPFAELADSFVRTLPRINTFLASNPPPVIGKVYRPSSGEILRNARSVGRIERWYP
jgi:hypothetical protein